VAAYCNHVSIAIGSHAEFATCMELASRLGFLTDQEAASITRLSDSVGRLLYRLHRALVRTLQIKAKQEANIS
jgi:four helix bundle protein